MPAPRELPIYELEPHLIAAVKGQGRLIVQAPTGSGKSAQVPRIRAISSDRFRLVKISGMNTGHKIGSGDSRRNQHSQL